MDSGNSGSLHSSSSAEDECNSFAGLITTQQPPHQPPPPPFNHHNNQINNNINSLFFSSSTQHQLLNLDPVFRYKTLPASFSDHHLLSLSSQPPVITATTSNNKNPKKRSRASRRAPTTVLTTDTNNFRAMVQEFTGIPSPPFTSPSPAFHNVTTRLDLFGRSSVTMKSNTNNFDNLTQLPSFLLPQPFYSPFIDPCNNILNTMQNPIRLSSNPINQPQLLNPKTVDNYFSSSNGFGEIGQIQMHEGRNSTSLPDLISTAATPTTTSSRNDELVELENRETGRGDNYTNGKESLGMKDDQGFIEPWICSSD